MLMGREDDFLRNITISQNFVPFGWVVMNIILFLVSFPYIWYIPIANLVTIGPVVIEKKEDVNAWSMKDNEWCRMTATDP